MKKVKNKVEEKYNKIKVKKRRAKKGLRRSQHKQEVKKMKIDLKVKDLMFLKVLKSHYQKDLKEWIV